METTFCFDLYHPRPNSIVYAVIAGALLIAGSISVQRGIIRPEMLVAFVSGMVLLLEPLQSLGGITGVLIDFREFWSPLAPSSKK